MQVGSLREDIIVALFIYKFGKDNVKEIPITESEVDVEIFGHPLSIKTITGAKLSGVKLIWTVDAQRAREFYDRYKPTCDILLVQINWGGSSPFYLIPLGAQQRIFGELRRENYIKLSKEGTNPRGVEITREALEMLVRQEETRSIPIEWQKTHMDYKPHERWIDFWQKEDLP